MSKTQDAEHTSVPAGTPKLVYVRAVRKEALPEKLRKATADIPAPYSVHAANGDRLAIVKDQKLAFALARQNNLAPVYVH